ncbi:hypothetical protein E1293_31315 [Actinomadura darangshiensis]|uniref:Uncharacterized protein n=1 Tax=Actinomadura darangshiensis TaxID=705336 RepID=A0A4R5AN54_9ACTN|nr:hypothetical protein [Actinomadura darangshiensis]TDD73445.1 hypothetical protein E1293_31315 [Actinomadura darangshiensis]
MEQDTFLLRSEAAPAASSGAQTPGRRRVRMELARPGSLARAFDNKLTEKSASATGGFGNKISPR